jgi:hypothetical protein
VAGPIALSLRPSSPSTHEPTEESLSLRNGVTAVFVPPLFGAPEVQSQAARARPPPELQKLGRPLSFRAPDALPQASLSRMLHSLGEQGPAMGRPSSPASPAAAGGRDRAPSFAAQQGAGGPRPYQRVMLLLALSMGIYLVIDLVVDRTLAPSSPPFRAETGAGALP